MSQSFHQIPGFSTAPYDYTNDLRWHGRRSSAEEEFMRGLQGMLTGMADNVLRHLIEPLKNENARLWERVEELEARLDELEDE